MENLRIIYDLQCNFKPITGDDLFSLMSVNALDKLYEKNGVINKNRING